ncbi:MAG: hypothetical protein ILP18_05900, partial [Treponema sp.]|nr:hypothetical protein [Treponema sp.]
MKKGLFSSCLKAAAALLLAFAVASCAQSAGGDDEGTVSGGTVSNAASTRRVGISVAGDKKQSGPAMLILPTVDNDASKYSYKLTGTSARGTTIAMDVAITAFNKPVEVELAATYWELTLTAYLGSDAALRGVRAVDLTNGAQDISFTLTPGNIEGGTGSVDVSGTFVLNPNAKRYVVGLYKMNTVADELVGTAEEQVIVGSSNSFSLVQDGYEPGEYVFKFCLFNDETGGDIISEYSDLIIVNSGIVTKAVIEIPDLNRVPAAPENFKAVRLNSSVTADTDGFYDVEFTWDDKSTNEKYFELVLTEYEADGTTEKGKQTLPIAAEDDTTKPFATYVSGSLNACNEKYTVRLPTGRLFDATLKAKTSRGSQGYASEAAERTDSSGGTLADASTGFGAPDATHRINTVRRVYDLNGGTLKLSGETEEKTGIYYQFTVYEGAVIPLLTIGSVASGGNILSLPIAGSSDTIAFDGWIDTTDGKKVAADYVPAACADGSYKAKFKSNSVSIADIMGYEDLADGKVAVNGSVVTKNTAVPVEQKDDQEVELDFKDPTGEFVAYLFKMDGALLS